MVRFVIPQAIVAIVLLQLPVVLGHNALFCCPALALAIGWDKVFYPNSAGYKQSADSYFARQEGELTPYCYIKPTRSKDVSDAVKALALLNLVHVFCPFAVRGGGHHTVIGIANINNGITIDLGDMNQTTLNADKSIASVQSGARWDTVYSALVAVGRGVLGGRVSDLGVGGFTTGGGISYFGGAYGFGCDMVSNFEIVLANGNIVNANPIENLDLFKALKGGSNNFGIVTRFDLRIFPLGDYWGGSNYYLGNQSPALLNAFSAFATNPNFDTKSALIVTTIYTSSRGFVTVCNFAYTEAVSNPPVFANFTSNIPYMVSETRISNLSDFSSSLGSETPRGLRQTSITATVRPVGSLLEQIYELWNETVPAISSAQNLVYSMTFQPIPVNMMNSGPQHGGNSLGLDSADGPLVVLTLTAQYTSPESDSIMQSTTRALFKSIEALASQQNGLNAWKYVNYADSTQAVIPSYGAANVQNLKAVARRVDPRGFFQKAQPGGFKLN